MNMRSVGARLGLGLALLAPAGAAIGTVGMAAPAFAATGGTSCSSNSGTADLSPGISNTPAVQTATISANASGCTGKVSGGNVKGTLKGTTKSSCATLAKTSTATGTLTVSWNIEATSTLKVTLKTTGQSSTLSGKVTSGLFKGGKVTGTLTPTGANGNCTTTPITQETFNGTLKIS